MVKPFDSLPGIELVISGHTNGEKENPTYLEVESDDTGHTEAVEIICDPEFVSYQELVEIHWQQADPTDAFGQFKDRGSSYRPVMLYFNEEQKRTAEKSRGSLQASGRFDQPIVATIEAVKTFYPADAEHQDYYQGNPENYQRNARRRNKFIYEV